MEADLHSSPRLPRDEMKRLLQRSDAPALRLFGLQLGAFVVLSVLALVLGAAASIWRWPVVVLDGLVLLMFFASMHEAGHGTAFATPWMNRVVLWISAFLMLQSPTFFREFHFEHHRSTSDPAADPEVSGAPRLLGRWPANPLTYFAVASGQHLMLGKALFTIVGALVPTEALFARAFPFIRPAYRGEVQRESRVVLLSWIVVLWAGLRLVDGFATLLAAWPVAHLALGLFVMPEHTGLPTDGSQLHRTRSMKSNALVHRAMWEMSWHAEHHAYPAVPWHRLPELHERIRPELEHLIPGYLAFHAEALRRSFGR